MLNRDDVREAYQSSGTCDYLAIDVNDLNRTFLDEIAYIQLGRYGGQIQEDFFL